LKSLKVGVLPARTQLLSNIGEEGADDFSEEYEWIRAKVALGRQYTGPVEGTAEGLTLRGPYGFIMRASESDPHRRPHTCFKWKKF
jgi:hypothetical protein